MSYPDFEEFIGSLNAHRVRYLVVGAYASASRTAARSIAERSHRGEGGGGTSSGPGRSGRAASRRSAQALSRAGRATLQRNR